MNRTPIPRISAKRLAELGGKMPFSTIRPRTKFPQKGKPQLERGTSHRKDYVGSKITRKTRKNQRQERRLVFSQSSGRRVNPKRRIPRVIHSERTEHITGHKRERLHGKAKSARRMEIFERSGGYCEAKTDSEYVAFKIRGKKVRCFNPINSGKYDPASNPNGMEWSHTKHAANKCDCLKCGIASCHGCHERSHNCGGKPITVTKKSLKENTV